MINDLLKRFKTYQDITKVSDTQVFNSLSLFVYYIKSKGNRPDLYLLAKILDEENYNRLIEYWPDETIRIPSKKEKEEADILSMCFYLKEALEWEWPEIIEYLKPLKTDINPYALGREINEIKLVMLSEMRESLDNVDLKNVIDRKL